jgi:hypothetical protein
MARNARPSRQLLSNRIMVVNLAVERHDKARFGVIRLGALRRKVENREPAMSERKPRRVVHPPRRSPPRCTSRCAIRPATRLSSAATGNSDERSGDPHLWSLSAFRVGLVTIVASPVFARELLGHRRSSQRRIGTARRHSVHECIEIPCRLAERIPRHSHFRVFSMHVDV